MRKNFTLLMLFVSVITMAQFPSPTNLIYTYKYIPMGDWGECNGKSLVGPTYCSSCAWQTPDVSSTTAKLTGYNVYVKSMGVTSKVATVTGLSYTEEFAVIGDIWVTAVYSDPVGESLPSNVQTNANLPVEVKAIKAPDKLKISCSKGWLQILLVEANLKLNQIRVMDGNGKLIKLVANPGNEVDLRTMRKGFYIVEVQTDNSEVFRQKIIL